jgi:hypothetical protein
MHYRCATLLKSVIQELFFVIFGNLKFYRAEGHGKRSLSVIRFNIPRPQEKAFR